MSDAAAGTTGQPASNAAPQLGQQSQGSQPQFSAEEIAQLQRAANQYKGAAPLINNAMKYGLKSPQDFDTYGPLIQTLRQSGTDPRQLMAVFSGNAAQAVEETGKAPENWTKADIERMVGEKVSKATADMIRQQAEKEHQAALDGELGEIESDETLDSLLGEYKESLGKDPKARELLKFAMAGYHAFKARGQYGDDHPLKGQYSPAGKDGMGKLKGWFSDALKATTTSFQASQAAQIGKGARAAAGTPAANSNGVSQGAPKDERKPGQPPSRNQLEAAYEELKASRRR